MNKEPFEKVLPTIRNMIFMFCRQIKPQTWFDKDDITQELTICAWKAYEKKYDPNKGRSPASFIYNALIYGKAYVLQKLRRHRIQTVSFNEDFYKTKSLLEDDRLSIFMEDVKKRYNKKTYDILKLYLEGYTLKDIGDKYKETKQNMQDYIGKIRKFYQENKEKY